MNTYDLHTQFTEASSTLARCNCGSRVVMQYDPGCTYIHYLAENKTKQAVADWKPGEMAREWNKLNNKDEN